MVHERTSWDDRGALTPPDDEVEREPTMPWDEEPGVWRKFLLERDLEDGDAARHEYLVDLKVQDQYDWFSRGFSYGGDS